MRILLDEQLPRQLARAIAGHEVSTVQRQGWSGLKNGELLRRAAAQRFDAFVTADQNLAFQQNLAGSPLRVVVLLAPTNVLDDLLPLIPELHGALEAAQAGEIVRVGRETCP